MDREQLKAWLDEGLSLEAIGKLVGRHPSTVSYWLRKHGLVANGHDKHAARGPLDFAALEAAAAEGLTLRQMASRFGISVATVRHWLSKHEITPLRTHRRKAAREAQADGRKRIPGVCVRHGQTDFVIYANGRSRCARCNVEGVTRRRREVKRILVEEAGGKCALCGYDRYPGALHFHHLDRAQKAFALGHDGNTMSLEKSRKEAGKCVLLCGNCHAEVEAGLASLS
jgi:transposase